MSERAYEWAPLDSAANIFPSSISRRRSNVFRMTCEMTRPVQPQLLQQALDRTVESFPSFMMELKRGFFWYYLEQSSRRPVVGPETEAPCAPLYDPAAPGLLFRVLYYRNRVSLETFHALADGTGALHFLRMLVFRYLQLAYPEKLASLPELEYDASETQSMDDSFDRYATGSKSSARTEYGKNIRLSGRRLPGCSQQLMTGTVPTERMLTLSKRYGVSLTVLLCGLYMQSIRNTLPVRDAGRCITISVPVNLRKHFESSSARNFFGVMLMGHRFQKNEDDLPAVLADLKREFGESLAQDRLQDQIDRYTNLIRIPAAHCIPLFPKQIGMRIGNAVFDRSETSSLSNIGSVSMPPQTTPYIRQFEAYMATPKTTLCVLSFNGSLTLCFSSAFVGTDIQRRFFRSIAAEGIPICLDATLCGAGEDGEGEAER